jgi:2-dehydro-3-deoxygluconokinase
LADDIEVLTIGEPMALFVADDDKALKDVRHYTRFVSGAELNVSVGLARLGHKVAYVSKVGRDPFGEHIKAFLTKNQIDNRYVGMDDAYLTGMQLKTKVTEGDPEVFNLRKNTAFSRMVPTDLDQIDWTTIKYMHVSGIPAAVSLGCRATVYELIDMAIQNGVHISFDPNLRLSLWPDKKEMVRVINGLAIKAEIFLPGVKEGRILMGSTDPETIAGYYMNQPESRLKVVVVKVGAKGAYVKERGKKGFMSPAYTVEKVVDTVGAGDGFAVGILSALLEGLSLKEAAHRGAAIGAMVVMVRGDNEGLPTRAKLNAFMEK